MTCPKCGIGRQARDRHLRQLRADPQDRQARRAAGAPAGRAAARWRCSRLMAGAGQLLFSVGVIVVALAFAAFVGHAVLLANGRRALPRMVVAPEPAFAGVVSGSFVERTATGSTTIGAAGVQPASPLSRSAHLLGLIAKRARLARSSGRRGS